MQNNKIDKNKIRLNLVGAIGNDELSIIPNNIMNILNILGPVHHNKSIEYLLKSDLLLLYMSNKRGLGCQ